MKPGEDPKKAKRRLVKIRPPFVSLVDMGANLEPFLIVKELHSMADQQDQNKEWVFSSEVKDGIVETLGTASQLIGDLLAQARDAGETGQELSGELPSDFRAKVAQIVALLQGGEAPADPETATMSVDADARALLVQALETALQSVAAQKEEVSKPETKTLPEGTGAALKSAADVLKEAVAKADEAAAAAKEAGDAEGETAAKATQEEAEAVDEKANEIHELLWTIANAVRDTVQDDTAKDPEGVKAAIGAKLEELLPMVQAAISGAAAAAPADDAEMAQGDDAEKSAADAPADDATDTEKAGAVFSKKNRERIETAVKLLVEAIDGARTAPDPEPATKATDADTKKSLDAPAPVAKARPRSRVEQPDSNPTSQPFAWSGNINDRRAHKAAAAGRK